MKHLTLLLLALFMSSMLTAQETDKVNDLISQGIKLHDAAKYDEAILKYKEALTLEPDNKDANYEIALTLFNTNARKEAIPYLQKVIHTKNNLTVSAYDLLGSIYDIEGQTDKAVESFNLGIQADPSYQRIYFNLAITYNGMGKNAEAITAVTKALQLNPGHASSHRLYAIVAAGDPDSKIKAVLAYCNFLLLEATTERSANAYKDLNTILNEGVAEKAGTTNITFNSKNKDEAINAANMAISLSSVTAKAIPNSGAVAQLELQLKSIFNIVGELSAKKTDKAFFWSYYADYFAKLAKTEYMLLVAHIIAFSSNVEENRSWIKDHNSELQGFIKWQSENRR